MILLLLNKNQREEWELNNILKAIYTPEFIKEETLNSCLKNEGVDMDSLDNKIEDFLNSLSIKK